ncbi:MAG TPA: hypothetical protein O0Y08_04145 [Methanocorpusculum sp.]|nr:hypothetical protein [Methanocorpusculum sp.]HJJ60035.1 hypothetical protein [Methanocorpusculum sp.]
MNIPELLAPAGSPDALKAAVYAGADAVYLGGKLFGARAYAANFDRKQIEDAISFAHSRGVRVYVTVNTLQRDADLAAAADYLRFSSDAGADAVLTGCWTFIPRTRCRPRPAPSCQYTDDHYE